MEVDVLVFGGFEEFDAIDPYEVLANAARTGADLSGRLVTLAAADEVAGSHGLRIRPDGVLDGNPDLVLVPGSGWNDHAEKGAWAEAQKGALPEAVASLHEGESTVAAVCTGGMLLPAAGLVRGRRAVTHHGALDELRENGAKVLPEARVVDAGDIVTAGGVTSGIDLALHLVERGWGMQLAEKVAEEMEYERRGRAVTSHQEVT